VKFGATVKLTDEDSGESFTYKIVGEDEANVKEKKISISSPIARAMIGKEEGDDRRSLRARRREIVRNRFHLLEITSTPVSADPCQGPRSGASLTVAAGF
jgi:hypothetical protein